VRRSTPRSRASLRTGGLASGGPAAGAGAGAGAAGRTGAGDAGRAGAGAGGATVAGAAAAAFVAGRAGPCGTPLRGRRLAGVVRGPEPARPAVRAAAGT